MHIVFASDDNYAPYLGVAMMSVLEHNNEVAFHVLDGGITEDNKEKLRSIAQDVTFYQIDAATLFDGFKTGRDYLSVAAFYRFLIPALLDPKIERCLYLDVDTLVMADLSAFYNTDILEHYFAVVEDECSVEQSERLGFEARDYFNSGVMLFNLTELRKFDFQKMCIDFYIKNKPQMLLDDQDVLNSLFVTKCKFSSLRYNANSRVFVGNKLEDPAIVHFTGDIKPWDSMSTHLLTKKYQSYLAKSPWEKAIIHSSYWQYLGYKLLTLLPFGKREDYKRKRDLLHGKIRRARELSLVTKI